MFGFGNSATFYEDEPSPNSPAEYEALSDKCFKEMLELKNNELGWEELPVNYDGIEFFQKPVDGYDLPMMKLSSILPASPEEVFDLIENATEEERKKYDPLLSHQEILEVINGNITITYQLIKAIFPLSNRDATGFKTHRIIDGGTYVVYGQTTTYKEKLFQRGCVRVKGKFAQFFEPLPGEKFKCRVI
jgi:hypothetical protein